MALTPLLSFLIGLIASFLGTLPFGPINLSVVDATLRKSLQAALWLAFAAALVEILQSFVALHCSMWISDIVQSSRWVKLGTFILFVGLGLFFFRKKSIEKADSASKKGGNFLRGLIIALLNPQAIPFWLFVLTYLETAQMIHLDTRQQVPYILLFLLGVAMGKFLALLCFGLMSNVIKNRTKFLNQWMNKILGIILLLIGLYQGVQIFLT